VGPCRQTAYWQHRASGARLSTTWALSHDAALSQVTLWAGGMTGSCIYVPQESSRTHLKFFRGTQTAQQSNTLAQIRQKIIALHSESFAGSRGSHKTWVTQTCCCIWLSVICSQPYRHCHRMDARPASVRHMQQEVCNAGAQHSTHTCLAA